MNNNEELKKRIRFMTDEEILSIIEESSKDYTEAAISIVKEEALCRGGQEAIKERLHQNQKEKELDLPKKSRFNKPFSFMLHFFSSRMPKKERYSHYPSLYVISTFFRVLAFIIATITLIAIIMLFYNILLGNIEKEILFLFSFLYLGVAFVILFAISEVLQVLVDIESNTRKSK